MNPDVYQAMREFSDDTGNFARVVDEDEVLLDGAYSASTLRAIADILDQGNEDALK